jgi:hypothetical protein
LQITAQIILFAEQWIVLARLLLFVLLAVMLVCHFACRRVAGHQAQLAACMETL